MTVRAERQGPAGLAGVAGSGVGKEVDGDRAALRRLRGVRSLQRPGLGVLQRQVSATPW